MAISATEQLLAFEQIKQLKAKYCRYIDTKRWELLGTLFAADTVFDGFGSAPSGADVATFVAGVSKRLQPCISVHHCHTPEIALLGDRHARGIWAMEDYLEWFDGSSPREAPGHRGFRGYGFYEEEYRQRETDGRWQISFMRLTRLRFDALPNEQLPPRPGALAPSTDWL